MAYGQRELAIFAPQAPLPRDASYQVTSNTAARPPEPDASRVPLPLMDPLAGDPQPAPARLRRGFTLIEMLLVMAIIATISALAVPALQQAVENARVAKAIGDIESMQIELLTWRAPRSRFQFSAGMTFGTRPR